MTKGDLRFVFDANVIVSASLIEESTSADALYRAIDSGIILISENTLHEIRDVLSRKKFDRYVARSKRRQFLNVLVRDTELVEPDADIQECRDPDDDKYLELAVSGRADTIVSGDKDLLVLNPFENIPIMRPDEFLVWLSEE